MKQFKIYLPKGTSAISLGSYLPQWTKVSYAIKLGAPPTAARSTSSAEYLRNFHFMNPHSTNGETQMTRIFKGKEVVLSADGGGTLKL
jgi:hypothetical protein